MLLESCIKKLLLYFIACLFALNFIEAAGAATLIWSGGGADELASNAGNWEGRESPQNGNAVIFDGTSSKNCTWDLNIALSSFKIGPGYEGSITINSDLTIDNPFTWTGGGGDNLASNPANWSGGAVPQDGDNIDIDGMNDCLWDLDISPDSLRVGGGFTGTLIIMRDLFIAGNLFIEGGVVNLNGKALSADGDILIGMNGSFYATSSVIHLKGNWINSGAFTAGTSTVILNGSDQTLYGDNTFYNLIKISDSADTVYFEAGRTLTILNNLAFAGTAGSLLSLRSTENDTSWFIDPGSTRNISYAVIRDMKNINQVGVVADSSNNAGNTDNVYFDIDQCM